MNMPQGPRRQNHAPNSGKSGFTGQFWGNLWLY